MNTLTKEKRITVIIPEDEHRKFKTFAAAEGITMSELVRRVVGEMSAQTIVTRVTRNKP